jgi:hypothetical protein
MAITSAVVSPVVSQVVSSVTGVSTIYRYFNNAVDTYATIPLAILAIGDTIAFSIITRPLISSSGKTTFVGRDRSWGNIDIRMFNSNRVFDFNTSEVSGTLDGVAINENVTTVPIDSLEHRLVFTALTAGKGIDLIGEWRGFDGGNSWPIYNIDITLAAGGSRSYAVDTISPTLVDSISGQNGSQVNYDASLWAEVS